MNFKELYIPLQAKIVWHAKECLAKNLQVFGHVIHLPYMLVYDTKLRPLQIIL